MKTLIIYATYSSGTQTASEVLTDTLETFGYDVTMKNVADINLDEIAHYDLVILGSPSWMIDHKDGQPHHLFLEFFNKVGSREFKNVLFAVFGLGDSSFAHFCGAVDHLEEFVDQVNGTLLSPSLKIDSYYFNQEKNDELLRNWLHEVIKNLPDMTSGRLSHL